MCSTTLLSGVHAVGPVAVAPFGCVCRLCRNLGFYAFQNLRELVENLRGSFEVAFHDKGLQPRGAVFEELASLLARITHLERFMRGELQDTHLDLVSATATHCMTCALTSLNTRAFAKDCKQRSKATEPLQKWEDVCRDAESKASKSTRKKKSVDKKTWWNAQCEVRRCGLCVCDAMAQWLLGRGRACACGGV